MQITGKSSAPRAIPEMGTHVGRCINIVDLGTQDSSFNGKPTKKNKIRFTWELPDLTHVFDEAKGPQPFVVSREFTKSIHAQSKFLPFIINWIGRPLTAEEQEQGINPKMFLGTACQVSVIHEPDGKVPPTIYANVGSVTKLMKGLTCPPRINPQVYFEIGTADQFEVFNTLPEFLQKKIAASDEWKAQVAGGGSTPPTYNPAFEEDPDALPF